MLVVRFCLRACGVPYIVVEEVIAIVGSIVHNVTYAATTGAIPQTSMLHQ